MVNICSIRKPGVSAILGLALLISGCGTVPAGKSGAKIPEAEPVRPTQQEIQRAEAEKQRQLLVEAAAKAAAEEQERKRLEWQERKKQQQLAAQRQIQLKKHQAAAHKVMWKESRPHQLTGDFAYSPLAKTFIRRMVRQYGFDGNHLNRLFSDARDTGLYVKPLRKRTKKSSSIGSWTRYRNFFITPRHINGGVDFWRKHRQQLEQAQRVYGVPPEYIVGILGVETIYGGNVGKHRVIDALATKAFNPSRRQKFFNNELEKFLLMARSEGLNPYTTMGSTAGALGLCQFMPSNYRTLAVDFNRNGVCNLWDPEDAIGSIGNYFQKHGWRQGGKVAVPAIASGKRYKSLPWGYKHKHSKSRLQRMGVVPTGSIDPTVRLIRLSTRGGEEVWLGGHNFYVITRYNHSSKYAMAVHQLAQEVKKRYLGPARYAALQQ